MPEARIAFIGGSGLYDIEGLTDREEVDVRTPFGSTSEAIVVGLLNGTPIAFLSRHGRGHRISPTELPARANIYALKTIGVERIVSISAVGSLKEEVRPLDIVIPDQLIDRTRNRTSTFFGEGIVAHVALAQPFCDQMSGIVDETARGLGVATHRGGTCVVIEGPQFSTRAESEMYRSWGASIIGMTALPEAKLAREAEICYTTMALVTDYDTWHDTEEQVSVELVINNLQRNVAVARDIITALVVKIPRSRECACGSALENAIITSPQAIPESAKIKLSAITDKYLKITPEVG